MIQEFPKRPELVLGVLFMLCAVGNDLLLVIIENICHSGIRNLGKRSIVALEIHILQIVLDLAVIGDRECRFPKGKCEDHGMESGSDDISRIRKQGQQLRYMSIVVANGDVGSVRQHRNQMVNSRFVALDLAEGNQCHRDVTDSKFQDRIPKQLVISIDNCAVLCALSHVDNGNHNIFSPINRLWLCGQKNHIRRILNVREIVQHPVGGIVSQTYMPEAHEFLSDLGPVGFLVHRTQIGTDQKCISLILRTADVVEFRMHSGGKIDLVLRLSVVH